MKDRLYAFVQIMLITTVFYIVITLVLLVLAWMFGLT